MCLIIQLIEQQCVLTRNEAAQLCQVHLEGNNCPPCTSSQLNELQLIWDILCTTITWTWKEHKSWPVLANLFILDYLNLHSFNFLLWVFTLLWTINQSFLSNALAINNYETLIAGWNTVDFIVILHLSLPHTVHLCAVLCFAREAAAQCGLVTPTSTLQLAGDRDKRPVWASGLEAQKILSIHILSF